MNESQYLRANRQVFPVVMLQMGMMLAFSILNCTRGTNLGGNILVIVVCAVGMAFTVFYVMRVLKGKKCGICLMGTASIAYCIYLLCNMSASSYAYCIPLMAASIIYLNVRFLYIGGAVAMVVNVIHTIKLYVAGTADAENMIFNVVVLIIVIVVVQKVSVLLTKFNEENLQVQKDAADKMILVADNLVKHFDSMRDKLDTLSSVINSNNDSMTNIADSTGSTAEAIQEQATMCAVIQESTETAEHEAETMVEKSKLTMENVAEGAKLVEGLKRQANYVEQASNLAAESTKQVNARVEEVKGIVATILSISSQTNLLALNASIEAARAGEAGKGFTVVAEEIRQLSEQTKEATNKITEIIKDLNTDAAKAVESMENSANSIHEQSEMIETTKDRFETIDQEMQELQAVISSIEGDMKSIIVSTNTISENISNLSATSEEIAASSTEGRETAQGAVVEMHVVKEVIDATYMLAQDLKKFAE